MTCRIVIGLVKVRRFEGNRGAILDRDNEGIIMENLDIIFMVMLDVYKRQAEYSQNILPDAASVSLSLPVPN